MAHAPPTPRLLLVCGPAAGGMRRHLEALAVGLPARGFAVAVAAPAAVAVAAPIARYALDLGDRPRPISDLGALRELRRRVREWKPDVVHAHGVKAALLTLAALPFGRPPVVVTFHNLWHGGPLTLPLRLLAPRAAAAIAVSAAVRDRLAAYGVRPRELVIIPNGLDLAAFPPAPTHHEGQPFNAAFLGRLTEEKGVPVLLEAARLVSAGEDAMAAGPLNSADLLVGEHAGRKPGATPSTTDDVRFLVAGDGPLRSDVEAEASRPGSRLEYLGHQENVLPIYHQADAVLMPSLAEGHPMTALEAMACGLPLVASRIGGLPEIVLEGATGVLVPPGDAGALVEAIAALAADRDRAWAMGAAGRRRVEAEFTLERLLERTMDVYRRVLE